jgi:DNA (cytosine-5)-methyltransferase 1
MRFIDLFAGLGGFHQALASLGHHCVFACEIDSNLANLYEENFGIAPHRDIRICGHEVPAHDILCAGFPCQPFSKAGDQLGFNCPQWGDLFDEVVKILKRHEPRFLVIENVPNILRHNNGRTWKTIRRKLETLGYKIQSSELSPHLFGIPQIRNRAIIIGDRDGLQDFQWPSTDGRAKNLDIRSVLDKEPSDARPLTPAATRYLEAWQRLLSALPSKCQLPSFPIWAQEFGATYPLDGPPPRRLSAKDLSNYRGTFGRPLRQHTKGEMLENLPPYATNTNTRFPEWKVDFILANRRFYKDNKAVIDKWLPQIMDFAPSFQKLEWNWKDGPRDIWSTVVQFRASGIRAKRPESAPSLVALTTSQVPVITSERRYMTLRECARLQSMGDLTHMPRTETAGFRALGNAVNVRVISLVCEKLLSRPPATNQLPGFNTNAKRHRTKLKKVRQTGVDRLAA